MTRLTAFPNQQLRRVLLICNGEQPSRSLARRLARLADCIIAADGGANGARKMGIVPDLIIGDLDSITTAGRLQQAMRGHVLAQASLMGKYKK